MEEGREGGRGEGGGSEVDLSSLHWRLICLLRAAAACDALASRSAVSCNGLPCSIQIRWPARAARTVKQRGAAVDALKAHKHGRAPVCTREREHMRARTNTSAFALACARSSMVSTIMDACNSFKFVFVFPDS